MTPYLMTPLEMLPITNTPLPKTTAPVDKSAAKETAREFEENFLKVFLEQMYSGIKTEAPFGGGSGESVFRSFLLSEYAGEMTKSGGIGITDQVYREIINLQEANNK